MNPETMNYNTAQDFSSYDWKELSKSVKSKDSNTASVPVAAEEGVATSIELETLLPYIATYIERFNSKELIKNEATVIKLNMLEKKRLRSPLDIIIEIDGEGFIARSVDFPLFGYGDDRIEAIDALKSEIESLHTDLMKDDNFTDEWIGIKNFLKKQVID